MVQIHEDLRRRHTVKQSSNRSFGIVFFSVFGLIAIWPIFQDGGLRIWALTLGLSFLLTALFKPSVLNPLNKAWTAFGLLLHKIVNPVVMGLIFYLTVLPTGLTLRILKKDLLHIDWDENADSYWIPRETSVTSLPSMKNQF